MESNDEEVRNSSKQVEAELAALQFLWTGMIRAFTPERRRFERWLDLIGYVETVHCVNASANEFIRNHGLMLPGQLIRFMDRAVIRVLRKKKAEQASKEVIQ